MSRPQKIHKPLKGDFTQIINAIADGKGVKPPPSADRMTRSKEVAPRANHPPKKQLNRESRNQHFKISG